MLHGHDPALIAAALSGLESALNRALELAPASSRELEELVGTLVAIECTSPEVEVFIEVTAAGSLRLMSYSEQTPATRVRGNAEDFVALATSDDPAATLINSNLEIIGNTAPLIALQQIVTRMDLDWEAPLVNTLGDVVGHQLAEVLRGSFRWGRQAEASLRRQLSEFILEEGQLSPPAAELEDFYEQIDHLGLRVDRLASRIQRLAGKLTQQQKP